MVRVDASSPRCSSAGRATGSIRSTSTRACPNVDYLLEFLRGAGEAPAGFERIQYIEQPTARDLSKDSGNVMHEAAKLARRGRRIADRPGEPAAGPGDGIHRGGPEGVQGPEPRMLMAAAAQKFGMFLCVQDLTCPGVADSFGGAGGARARQRGHRGQRPPVRARGQRGLGARFPACSHPRRRDGDRPADRPRTGGGAAGTPADGSLTPANVAHEGPSALRRARRKNIGDILPHEQRQRWCLPCRMSRAFHDGLRTLYPRHRVP